MVINKIFDICVMIIKCLLVYLFMGYIGSFGDGVEFVGEGFVLFDFFDIRVFQVIQQGFYVDQFFQGEVGVCVVNVF